MNLGHFPCPLPCIVLLRRTKETHWGVVVFLLSITVITLNDASKAEGCGQNGVDAGIPLAGVLKVCVCVCGGGGGGVPVSRFDNIKICHCRMSLLLYIFPMSHVNLKKRLCRMSLVRMSLRPMSPCQLFLKKWPCRRVDFRGQYPYYLSLGGPLLCMPHVPMQSDPLVPRLIEVHNTTVWQAENCCFYHSCWGGSLDKRRGGLRTSGCMASSYVLVVTAAGLPQVISREAA